ncbi:MAG: LacI family DNA-binding transcriptional regulator [Sandarakinorhabdus sp.]|nr:LacI family DNA-binding transcriptional regulator [Sandarakinorhabdus sp.]
MQQIAKTETDSHPTMQDLAGLSGVSISTVSRALAGSSAISAQTRNKVQQAAADLGYRMPAQGRSRKKAATGIVGVVVGALHNPFLTSMLQHLHDALLGAGYRITLIIDPMNDSGSLQQLRPMIDGLLDGIIFATATLDSPVVAELKRRGIPLVLVVRSVDDRGVDTVEIDNVHAGMVAARHLYQLGHRRIGLAMGQRNTSTSRDRAQGAMKWLAEQGMKKKDMQLIWGEYTMESGYSSAMSLLGGGTPVTAIIAGNDTIALGVIEAAARSNIAVPDELSIIGFDDMPLSGTQLIALTTIRQPVEAMARTAASRLLDRMGRQIPPAPSHDILPIHLIQRRTTGPAKS